MAGKATGAKLQRQLLDKSMEAYVHALETINRLSMKYRQIAHLAGKACGAQSQHEPTPDKSNLYELLD